MGQNRIHRVKSLDTLRHPAECKTYCGMVGVDEGCDEWTTYGTETRFEAVRDAQGVTCKRCQKAEGRP